MILYKAIKYSRGSPCEMSSSFEGKYRLHSCWEDLVTTAFSHVSSGDKKNVKDYWISATKNLQAAIDYLDDKKYEYKGYNGIAVIDLPNTLESGRIFDNSLREFGYIDKEIALDEVKSHWSPNGDGIVASLDMSSPFTLHYLAAFLWLKGNRYSLGNLRAINYASAREEILLLGDRIKFEFWPEKAARKVLTPQFANGNFKQAVIPDHNMELFKVFLENAPESRDKNDWLGMFKIYRHDIEGEIEDKLRNEGCQGEHLMVEVKKEVERIKDDSTEEFFKNARWSFDRNKAKKRFSEFARLFDKEIIDFSEYEIVSEMRKLNFYDYLYAYIYAGAYYSQNTQSTGEIPCWKILNTLHDSEYIPSEIRFEDFFNFYTHSLGVCRNKGEN